MHKSEAVAVAVAVEPVEIEQVELEAAAESVEIEQGELEEPEPEEDPKCVKVASHMIRCISPTILGCMLNIFWSPSTYPPCCPCYAAMGIAPVYTAAASGMFLNAGACMLVGSLMAAQACYEARPH